LTYLKSNSNGTAEQYKEEKMEQIGLGTEILRSPALDIGDKKSNLES
jgi:hypothetical protein